MKTFKDLEHGTHPNWRGDGTQSKMQFENGFGVSVIRGASSYGGPEGLYEMAVLDSEGELTYDTPVTDDVLGHLTEDMVTRYMKEVQELPKVHDNVFKA